MICCGCVVFPPSFQNRQEFFHVVCNFDLLHLSDFSRSIIAQGGKEDMDRFAKTLNLPERGKIYVKGLFDTREEDLILTVAAASNEASSSISASDAAVEPKQE